MERRGLGSHAAHSRRHALHGDGSRCRLVARANSPSVAATSTSWRTSSEFRTSRPGRRRRPPSVSPRSLWRKTMASPRWGISSRSPGTSRSRTTPSATPSRSPGRRTRSWRSTRCHRGSTTSAARSRTGRPAETSTGVVTFTFSDPLPPATSGTDPAPSFVATLTAQVVSLTPGDRTNSVTVDFEDGLGNALAKETATDTDTVLPPHRPDDHQVRRRHHRTTRRHRRLHPDVRPGRHPGPDWSHHHPDGGPPTPRSHRGPPRPVGSARRATRPGRRARSASVPWRQPTDRRRSSSLSSSTIRTRPASRRCRTRRASPTMAPSGPTRTPATTSRSTPPRSSPAPR